MKQGEVNMEFILFNVGKQLYQTQREVTGWKNRWLKNGEVIKIEQEKIEIEFKDGKDIAKGLNDFSYDLGLYPFLYYREIVNIEKGFPERCQVITIVKDLKQVRELMIKELLDANKSIFRAVVLYYCDLLHYKIVVNHKEGYIETHSLSTCNIVDKIDTDLKIEIEFNIYEIEEDGIGIDYSYTYKFNR